MAGCGAEDLANDLMTDLVGAGEGFDLTLPDFSGEDFEYPEPGNTGIGAPVPRLSASDITTGAVDGDGTFDRLMRAVKAHLVTEYQASRISGAEYTKAYIAMVEGAMANATQFLLGRDQAYWQAVNAQVAAQTAQIQLVTARVQLESEKARLQLLRTEALTQKSNYALAKLRLASESVGYCTAKYNLEEMLPQQKSLLLAQISRASAELTGVNNQNAISQGEIDRLPDQAALLAAQVSRAGAEVLSVQAQTALVAKQTAIAQGEVERLPNQAALLAAQVSRAGAETLAVQAQTGLVGKQTLVAQGEVDRLPNQAALLAAQVAQQTAQTTLVGKQTESIQKDIDLYPTKLLLLKEQAESQRAQTLDSRSDGVTPVTGSVGSQRKLYEQQIKSYQRDAEVKAARIFTDAWITQKTIDEGLAPPTQFSNANLDDILETVKLNNQL